MSAKKIIFITGTDTGVGKTLLTALLLQHLRRAGVHALAMKPFCSGGLDDVRLLQSLQPGELGDAEMNPFYFAQPVAPLVAREQKRKPVRLARALQRITALQKKCGQLLVEGSGGLLVPLGSRYTVADLIRGLNCRVIIVARNQLGTLNHTLLTVGALKSAGLKANELAVVLMSGKIPDLSSRTNRRTLSKLLPSIPVLSIPYLGPKASTAIAVKAYSPRLKRTLEQLARG